MLQTQHITEQQFPFNFDYNWHSGSSGMNDRERYRRSPAHLAPTSLPPSREYSVPTPPTSNYDVSTPRSYTHSPSIASSTAIARETNELQLFQIFPDFYPDVSNTYGTSASVQYLPAASEMPIYGQTIPPTIRHAYAAGYDEDSRRGEHSLDHIYQDRSVQETDRDIKRLRLSPFSEYDSSSSEFDSKDRASTASLSDYSRSPQMSSHSSPVINDYRSISPNLNLHTMGFGNVPNYQHLNANFAGLNKKPRKNRRRLGTLERKQVHQLRKMGACTRCWGLKMKCDKGSPCHRCEKLCHSVCVRVHFVDLDVFSKWLVDSYSRSMMHHHVLKWTEKPSRTITVSHAKCLNITLKLTVYEFEPAFAGQLQYWFKDDMGWKSMPSPPYAMKRSIGTEDLENYIRDHTYHFVSTAFLGNRVMSEIFSTAYTYSRSLEDNFMLHDTLQLWAANQLLLKGATLHQNSDALETLPIASATSPYAYQTPLPRVTANQLDHLIERRIWQLEKQILAELQKKIFARKKEDWLKIFFTLVVLMNTLERDTWRLYYWHFHMNEGNEWRHPATPEKLIEKNDTLAQSLAAHFTAISKGVTPFALDWSHEQTKMLVGGKCQNPEAIMQAIERMGRWLRNPEHARQTMNVYSRYRDNDENSLDFLYSSKAMIVY